MSLYGTTRHFCNVGYVVNIIPLTGSDPLGVVLFNSSSMPVGSVVQNAGTINYVKLVPNPDVVSGSFAITFHVFVPRK